MKSVGERFMVGHWALDCIRLAIVYAREQSIVVCDEQATAGDDAMLTLMAW